eukprot:TRINITY_DN13541_c0_g1::TRINITY_DN13541_c0_g1_i1::g.22122::m.22122 TRINITY_DN13541_c0_g1::TRINITY_DN13541_c0_g1_i1::g.22122  ORF type:complete len:321 (+),score=53.23,sp/Q9H977/WDR54_HUMAN/28.85/3e-21,WD40/PF00400.27/1.6e+02,WD40/PF00400.27/4.6e-05,WD40/PF00400.27/4.2e+03 TRINITY_DN13541_c0_g1_i1:65-1027(+)
MYEKTKCQIASLHSFTPSLLNNNLSAKAGSTPVISFVRTSEVILFEPKDSGATEPRPVPYQDPVPVVQSRFVQVGSSSLLVLATETTIQVWTADGARLIYCFKIPKDLHNGRRNFARGIVSVCNAQKDYFILVGTVSGEVHSLSVVNGTTVHHAETIPVSSFPITDIGSDATKPSVALIGNETGELITFTFPKDKKVVYSGANRIPCTSVKVSRDMGCAGYLDGHIRFVHIPSGTVQVELSAHARAVTAMDVSWDGNWLVSVSEDMYVNVWAIPHDNTKISNVFSVNIPDALLTGVAFTDQENSFAVAAYDAPLIRIWRT